MTFSVESDWPGTQVLCDHPLDDCGQCFPGLREHKVRCRVRPIKLEAGRKRGDPYLAWRSVGGDHKLAWRLLKQDIEHAILFFDFKAALFLGLDEALLEGIHRRIAVAAECSLI
jgi:hypothetical protein